MSNEFKSFFKAVGGNEGGKCNYATRLDTYGCGCQHNCAYCYARALLDFRGLWNPTSPAVADINEIRKTIARELKRGDVVRLGGMTDERTAKTHLAGNKGCVFVVVGSSRIADKIKSITMGKVGTPRHQPEPTEAQKNVALERADRALTENGLFVGKQSMEILRTSKTDWYHSYLLEQYFADVLHRTITL